MVSYTEANQITATQTQAEVQPGLETRAMSSTVTSFRTLPEGTPVGSSGWRLARDIGVETVQGDTSLIASYPLLDEYGVGPEYESAVQDLLISLVEYRESLQRRQDRIAAELQRDLAVLETILERSTG